MNNSVSLARVVFIRALHQLLPQRHILTHTHIHTRVRAREDIYKITVGKIC